MSKIFQYTDILFCKHWSALASAPAETSAEVSYDFEIWHVVLSYQKNMIGTLKKFEYPPSPNLLSSPQNIS
jgi:hypothetical protein